MAINDRPFVVEDPPQNGYPEEDFTSRIPIHIPRESPRPSRWLRLYVMLRKLIRRKQESADVKSARAGYARLFKAECAKTEMIVAAAKKDNEKVRADCAKEVAAMTKRIEARDRALDELRQKIERQVGELQATIASRDKTIRDLTELEIPKIRNELAVEKEFSLHLAALSKKKLKIEEAEIAVANMRTADAENAVDQARELALRQMRGER